MGKSDLPFYCLHCCILLHNQEITKLKGQIIGLDKVNVSSSAQQTSNSNPTANSTLAQPQQSYFQSAGRKFNLVVFGINECPSGTSRLESVKRDLDSTIFILTKLNPEINPSSIRDCFRLGKYKPPHPVPSSGRSSQDHSST